MLEGSVLASETVSGWFVRFRCWSNLVALGGVYFGALRPNCHTGPSLSSMHLSQPPCIDCSPCENSATSSCSSRSGRQAARSGGSRSHRRHHPRQRVAMRKRESDALGIKRHLDRTRLEFRASASAADLSRSRWNGSRTARARHASLDPIQREQVIIQVGQNRHAGLQVRAVRHWAFSPFAHEQSGSTN
jgi:hypothetical protein